MKKNILLISVMLAVVSMGAWGQVAAWDFNGENTVATSTAEIFNANMDASNSITRGAGAAASAGANSFRTTGFSNDGISTANTDYFQITLSASVGYALSLSTIDARFAGTASFFASPGASAQFAYSLDGSSFTLIGSAFVMTSASAMTQIDVTGISALQNVDAGTTVTIRYYASGQTTTGGWGFSSPSVGQYGLAIGGSVVSTSTPNINVSPSTITGFSYVEGSGPSPSQSYSLSGTNLTGVPGNITVTGSTNYEVSTDNSSFSASVNVAYASATLSSTPVYVRLKSGLAAGSYNSETISNAGGGATTQNVTASGSVYKQEPTNHATSFASAAGTPTHTSINLSWIDATGGTVPDGYLIKGSTTSFAAIVDPVDGTAESNGAMVKNVASAVQTATFPNLTPSATYYFKIYPYTNSSTNINYKTDGTVPTTSLTTDAAPPASLLLEENFNYTAGTLLTDNGWIVHSSGAGGITVMGGGLTFTDYSSIVGNAALVDSTGEDINRTFTEVSFGSVYVSFLVKVDTIANGYFLNIGPSSMGTTLRGRVFIQNFSSNLQFGLSKGSNTGTFSSNNYSTGTTYLLILKYEIVSGDDNDEVSLFVFESIDDYSSEPVTPTVGPLTDAAISDINPGSVALRQYSVSQDIIVDGIRVSESWSFAPLPVELTSFTAVAKGKGVELAWQTATEMNNYGFEIERKQIPHNPPLQGGSRIREADEAGGFEKVGFVSGNGTTNSPHTYSFTDATAKDKVVYRLKQIDNDGKFEYSNAVEVKVSAPEKFVLMQNHPNPFNPATEIRYQMSEVRHVSLKVYDMLGREVATLVNEVKEAGEHTAEFDASSLPSGVYFYTLRTSNFTATKKMLMIK